MEISQEKLRELIMEVLQELLDEQAGKKEDRNNVLLPSAYVACEAGRGDVLLGFLRNHKEVISRYRLTVVLEKPDAALSASLISEELCSAVAGPEDVVDGEMAVTFYPAFSRSALCEAALGMDTLFSSRLVRKDFEAGRKSVILTGGMDPFTGKEPAAYRDMILSYIRSLIGMGVSFMSEAEAGTAAEAVTAKTHSETVSDGSRQAGSAAAKGRNTVYTLNAGTNLVTACEIRSLPKGSTVLIPEGKLLTPSAKDALRDQNITVVRN